MKRKLISSFSLTGIVILSLFLSSAAIENKYDESKIVPSWGIQPETQKLKADNSGMIMPEPVINPEPVFKENINLPQGNYYDINKKIDKERLKKENAELVDIKAMTYEDYCKLSNKNTDEINMLSPKRMLWIVKTQHPNGVKVPTSDEQKKIGVSDTIKNATVIDIFDAETGEYIGTDMNAN